ncbi:hypothetical protein CASFOL_004853 [Castilleja foliolosa]|uniref:Uncharacterized protein n=1 Tax=Castilleja foliolosa TaxID=1961234 RepID=A0ABD3EF91_9LAMI
MLKTLWIAAADITEPKHIFIEVGVVGQNKVDVYINQEDIIGLLISRKISIPVMQLYNKTSWQLIILCPKYNYVAWFCFLQTKPSKRISTMIETAFNAYPLMKGTHCRQLKKLKWVYPKCCKRGGG